MIVGVRFWWPPKRVINMRMRDLCVQVENSRSVGKPGTTGSNINRTKTASSALFARRLSQCKCLSVPTTSREKDSYAVFVVNGFSN